MVMCFYYTRVHKKFHANCMKHYLKYTKTDGNGIMYTVDELLSGRECVLESKIKLYRCKHALSM